MEEILEKIQKKYDEVESAYRRETDENEKLRLFGQIQILIWVSGMMRGG